MTTTTEIATAEEFNAAIEKLGVVYGSDADPVIELLVTVRDDEVVHTTEPHDAFAHTAECTGCLTERIADAITRAAIEKAA